MISRRSTNLKSALFVTESPTRLGKFKWVSISVKFRCLLWFCRRKKKSPSAAFSRPSRLHDVRGGAAVHRVGPFLRHVSVPDHAGPHGAEQGQLGRHAAGSSFARRGGGAQRGRCGRRRRERLQRNTSGKQRIVTVMAFPPSPQPPDAGRRPSPHTGGQVGLHHRPHSPT